MFESPFGKNIVDGLEGIRTVADQLKTHPGLEYKAEVLEKSYTKILDNVIAEVASLERTMADALPAPHSAQSSSDITQPPSSTTEESQPLDKPIRLARDWHRLSDM